MLLLLGEEIRAQEVNRCLSPLGHAVVAVAHSAAEIVQTVETISASSVQPELVPELVPDLVIVDLTQARHPDVAAAIARLVRMLDVPVIYLARNAEDLKQPRAAGAGRWEDMACVLDSHELPLAAQLALGRRRRAHPAAKQRARARIETELQDILDNVSEGIFAYDTEWCYTYVNRRAAEIVRKEQEYLIGKNIWEEFPELLGSIADVEFHRAVAEQVPVHFDSFYPFYDLWYEISLYPSEQRVLAIIRDITERKLAEQQISQLNDDLRRHATEVEAVNAELEAFSYSVSHDLRAPLRSIHGFSEALLEDYTDVLDEQGKGYLHRVCRASERMAQLIDDLLDLSRMTRSTMQRESCNMSNMASVFIDTLRKDEPEREVDVVIEPGLQVHADSRLLRVAMENLLGNAWKFTSRQEHARIELGTTQVDGRTAYFVRDNGAGFDMAYTNKLFGAFQRLHGANEFEGTGIGLATVRRIIRRHGGEIWAEGKVGAGATFTFTLP